MRVIGGDDISCKIPSHMDEFSNFSSVFSAFELRHDHDDRHGRPAVIPRSVNSDRIAARMKNNHSLLDMLNLSLPDW